MVAALKVLFFSGDVPPVPLFVAVIFAPGTRASAVSVMVPLMVPSVWVCANPSRQAQTRRTAKYPRIRHR